MPELRMPDQVEREDLGAFVARSVRLDGQSVIRLRNRGTTGRIDVWGATPFDALCTRSVEGEVEPADVTVSGNELLASLTVAGGPEMDPGPQRDLLWRSELPPPEGWRRVDDLPAKLVGEVADRGIAMAKENVGPKGTPPASLLDQEVFTVSGSGLDVKIPLRCLFVLSGMGFLVAEPAESEIVRVSATDSWLRMDSRYGAVVRRRHALLSLLM
ncbi:MULTISPECIES: hypothetical protein [unclassified Saccharopolyspora]|uniref:hypothetical protein n=1 Tax=unclassified Saccharopolyspora TaxID=2646250 RepID=UPI001CD3B937|nr:MULTISPECIES: hypothetical protein [unclassified Saccharopolyspora]MCA1186969.1 hypothetical protein [Saccharopolyspora sp. 6T]MCA1227752.1 hypothetical protein [Saccharopolyspora sp. 6M]MCA1281804.1 hypothetical protein [Saccharopolyspora sp. 7B]